MFWFLYFCVESGVVVFVYEDIFSGIMVEIVDGGGYFISVMFYLKVKVVEVIMFVKVDDLYYCVNKLCFIVNLVNFFVLYEGSVSC